MDQTPAATDREQLIQFAQRRAAELEAVIEDMPAGVYIGGQDGITLCNRLGLRMLGFSSLEEMQENIAALADRLETRFADTGERVKPDEDIFVRAFLYGESATREVELRHIRSGRTIVIDSSVAPIYEGEGEQRRIVAAVAVNLDITSQKAREQEARQNASQLRLAMKAGRLGAFTLDLGTGHMDCTAQCKANFGLSADAVFTYSTLLAMIHPLDRASVQAAVEQALRERVDYKAEYRILLPQGETRWIAARGHATYGADGTPAHLHGVTQDITEREAGLLRLREAEEHFRALADNIAQLAWMADATGSVFWYNQRWYDYTGLTPEEMQGWDRQKVQHPDYVDAVREKFRSAIALGEPWEDTFPLRGRDGSYRWFLSRANPTRDPQGNIVLWCGTNTDVTEQRETQAALKQAEERVRSLYELTSRTDLAFDEKVKLLLRTGREWLGLRIGVLARIDCGVGSYEVAGIDASGEAPPVGFRCKLEETFCSETVKSTPQSPPIAVENAGANEEWRVHPAYQAFGSEAYLSTVVWRGGEVWGTLSFVSGTPRREPFTEFDKDLVRLMTQWIGGEVARQDSEAALRATAFQQRRFVREMLASVTEGKLCLCDSAPDDLPEPLPVVSDGVPLTPETLRQLRKRVEAVAAELQFSQERTQDLLTAVGEAGMNAVKHGDGGSARVHTDPDQGIIQVWIVDHGKGIREEDLHRATLEKGWSGGNSLGHGFFLMLRTVDRTYLLTGAQGTTIVLEQERTPPQPAWLQEIG